MKYVLTLWTLLKIKVKYQNVCRKAIYERMKNAKISAIQINLHNQVCFIYHSKKSRNFCLTVTRDVDGVMLHRNFGSDAFVMLPILR